MKPTKLQSIVCDQSGQGLMSALMGIAISAIVLTGIMSMNANQDKALKGFAQKADKLEIQGWVFQALSNSTNCSWQIKHPNCLLPSCLLDPPQVLDMTDAATLLSQSVELTKVFSGADFNSLLLLEKNKSLGSNSNLVIGSIQFKNFKQSGTTGQLFADLVIDFDQAFLARPLSPVVYANTIVNVNMATAGNIKPIDSCAIPGLGSTVITSAVSHGIKVFNYSATLPSQDFVIPAGVTQVYIQAWGAGGGGTAGLNSNGGFPDTTGAGGGGGGYGADYFTVNPGDVITATVGFAPPPATNATKQAYNGNPTAVKLGSILILTAAGGKIGYTNGGLGGLGSGAAGNPGADGTDGGNNSGNNSGGNGTGGSSPLGGAGGGNGASGAAPGGGGAGGHGHICGGSCSGSKAAGGQGGHGRVMISW